MSSSLATAPDTQAKHVLVDDNPQERRIALLEQEVARLRQDLDLLTTLERYRDAILARHPEAQGTRLATTARVEASEFLNSGSGFYHLEYGSNGDAYRWTGPEPEARITVWVDRSVPLLLRLAIHNFGRSERLTVRVDGQIYSAARPVGQGIVTLGPLPPRAGIGPTDIVLVPSSMFRPEDAGEPDNRTLGVTLLWLALEPDAS